MDCEYLKVSIIILFIIVCLLWITIMLMLYRLIPITNPVVPQQDQ